MSILSIASGPAEEVKEFIKRSDPNLDCNYTLVDLDPRVLQYCQEVLLNMKYAKKHSIKLNFINFTIRQLLRTINKMDMLKQQDIIYIFGLFDYLPMDFCKLFLKVLFKNLKKSGELLISNVSRSNQFRCYMEHGGDWYLYHRDEKELMEIGDNMIDATDLRVTCEKTGNNIFLLAKK